MEGLFSLLRYLGVVLTAYAVLKLLVKFVQNSSRLHLKLANNTFDLRTLHRLARHLAREDYVIFILFLVTSLILFLKYFSLMPTPTLKLGYEIEFFNLLCILYFVLCFHITDLRDQPK